jgi:hypothetical protein
MLNDGHDTKLSNPTMQYIFEFICWYHQGSKFHCRYSTVRHIGLLVKTCNKQVAYYIGRIYSSYEFVRPCVFKQSYVLLCCHCNIYIYIHILFLSSSDPWCSWLLWISCVSFTWSPFQVIQIGSFFFSIYFIVDVIFFSASSFPLLWSYNPCFVNRSLFESCMFEDHHLFT